MRDRQEPLHEREPPIEVAFDIVGVVDVEVHTLLVDRRRIAVGEEGEVGPDPSAESTELQSEVEPPAGVALAEQNHQQRREEQRARDAGAGGGDPLAIRGLHTARAAARDDPQHDGDRDDQDDPKRCRDPIESLRVVDRQASGIGRVARGGQRVLASAGEVVGEEEVL